MDHTIHLAAGDPADHIQDERAVRRHRRRPDCIHRFPSGRACALTHAHPGAQHIAIGPACGSWRVTETSDALTPTATEAAYLVLLGATVAWPGDDDRGTVTAPTPMDWQRRGRFPAADPRVLVVWSDGLREWLNTSDLALCGDAGQPVHHDTTVRAS